jgi:hypothetical protein
VALNCHEGRLLTGKEHHPSFAVADNEMKRSARTVLHKNWQPVVVIDGRHQRLDPPFAVETYGAQAGARIRRATTCAVTSEMIPKIPGDCRSQRSKLPVLDRQRLALSNRKTRIENTLSGALLTFLNLRIKTQLCHRDGHTNSVGRA